MNAVVSSLLLLVSAVVPVTEGTWPAFRGDGSNHTPASNLPLEWSPEENIAWKTTLRGYGQSSPVIWDGLVFVTTIEGEEKETSIVTAYDMATGGQRWQHSFPSAQRIENTSFVSKAAPTPVADANGVYAFFESGDIVGLSHSGEVLWQKNLVEEYGVAHVRHGIGNSLAHTDNAVILLIEQAEPSLLLAFDKATGEEKWKATRDGITSWTTPVVATVGGLETILITSSNTLTRYDAQTGKLLGKLDALSGISIPSPAVSGDVVVVGANSTRPTEGERTPEQSNCAIRLASAGDESSFEVLWEGDGQQADYASPLIYEGNVYLVTKRGDVHCRELATGAVRYTERVHPCWATPIAAGDRIYLFGKEGEVTVIAAGNEFKVLAENRMWPEEPKKESEKEEEADADPRSREYASKVVLYAAAAVDGTLIARTGDTLYAIRDLNKE